LFNNGVKNCSTSFLKSERRSKKKEKAALCLFLCIPFIALIGEDFKPTAVMSACVTGTSSLLLLVGRSEQSLSGQELNDLQQALYKVPSLPKQQFPS
jgi:hypothetical protein